MGVDNLFYFFAQVEGWELKSKRKGEKVHDRFLLKHLRFRHFLLFRRKSSHLVEVINFIVKMAKDWQRGKNFFIFIFTGNEEPFSWTKLIFLSRPEKKKKIFFSFHSPNKIYLNLTCCILKQGNCTYLIENSNFKTRIQIKREKARTLPWIFKNVDFIYSFFSQAEFFFLIHWFALAWKIVNK